MDIVKALIVVICWTWFSTTNAAISTRTVDDSAASNGGQITSQNRDATKVSVTSGNHSRRNTISGDKYVQVDLRGIKQNIRSLLNRKKFAELNSLLDSFQKETESDISYEVRLFAAYHAFRIHDLDYEKLFSEWINVTPDSYQPYLARASFYYALGLMKRERRLPNETRKEQFEAVRKYFQSSELDTLTTLSINKSVLVPYCLLIGIKDADSDTDYVIQEALRISPTTYEVRECYLRSIAPRWGGSYKKMQKFVDESLAYSGINAKLNLLKGEIYAEAGRVQALNRKYKLAEKLYAQALNFGTNHMIYERRGVNNYKQKKYELALSDLNKAIELYPASGSYYYWRSLAFTKLKQYDKAAQDIELAQQIEPWDRQIQEQVNWLVQKLEYMGYGSNEINKLDNAISQYSAAIRLDPARSSAYYRRAISYAGRRNPVRAINDIKRAIKLSPDEFLYYKLLDGLLAQNQDWDQIIKYWDRYISVDPKEGQAYVELGGAYYRKGDIQSAVHNAKIAADMGNHAGKAAYDKFRHMLK